MKSYQSHKIIEAGQILAFKTGKPLEHHTGFHETVFEVRNPDSPSGRELVVVKDPSILKRGEPAEGDYLVKYNNPDGTDYYSWSPKSAFETGNSPVTEIPNNGPRVHEEKMTSLIADTNFYIVPGTTTTICTLILKNGYTVVGKSACVSPENFVKTTGQKFAFQDARRQISELEGYLLIQKLHDSNKKIIELQPGGDSNMPMQLVQLSEEMPRLATCLESLTRYTSTSDGLIISKRDNGRYFVNFYTNDHKYQISAKPDGDNDNGYLGCKVTCRQPLEGETHLRGNDLPDGPYSDSTWLRILSAIVAYEIQTVDQSAECDVTDNAA